MLVKAERHESEQFLLRITLLLRSAHLVFARHRDNAGHSNPFCQFHCMDVSPRLTPATCRPVHLSACRWMLVGLIVACRAAWGASLGDVYVRSMAGQPLVAEIPIVVDSAEAASLEGSAELDGICEEGNCPLRIVAALKRSAGNAGVLRIYSDLPVHASGLKLRAWLRWEAMQGKTAEAVRTYVVRFAENGGAAQKAAVVGLPEAEQPRRKAKSPVTINPGGGMVAGGAPAAVRVERGALSEEISTFVREWAAAWSGKNMGAYLGAYADDYAPSGMDRSEWVSERTRRIAGREEPIDVWCAGFSVKPLGAGGAVATFYQSYQTPTWRSRGLKTMRLVRMGEAWKIVEERMDSEHSVPGRHGVRRR